MKDFDDRSLFLLGIVLAGVILYGLLLALL